VGGGDEAEGGGVGEVEGELHAVCVFASLNVRSLNIHSECMYVNSIKNHTK
jgi:hypothetical protein